MMESYRKGGNFWAQVERESLSRGQFWEKGYSECFCWCKWDTVCKDASLEIQARATHFLFVRNHANHSRGATLYIF
ncbi:hypothetical protein Y1Q_0019825 [Alligator mississippiensis]|uniref:Uncharacterized protein n=1 Tax=Alligator mississippiensis TaxID=8496 RepID=A0A151PFF7_ALLMI|nr:hypothetical protein Y1Q_0019825 [Alligator mississippiensis]